MLIHPAVLSLWQSRRASAFWCYYAAAFTNSIKSCRSCVALFHLQRVFAAACEVREFVHLDFQVLNNFKDINVDC